MKAVRIHAFGAPDRLILEDLETPRPSAGQTLVRVHAAGVGPWDAWIRAGRSVKVSALDLPATLGSDIAGIMELADPADATFAVGDPVFGVTNARFTGGYATHALAETHRLVKIPCQVSFEEAASLPVIGVTAWQMLALLPDVAAGSTVVVLGASGNVGALLVQLARLRGLHVRAFGLKDTDGNEGGEQHVERIERSDLARACAGARAVLDTVGGESLVEAMVALPKDGVVVSIVEPPDLDRVTRPDLFAHYFIVDVQVRALAAIAALVEVRLLKPRVGDVLPLAQAREAHEMLDGSRLHAQGKIVLRT